MNKKPEPKRQLAIKFYDKTTGIIAIEAIPDIIEDFRQYGNLYGDNRINRYDLFVSKLYDFDEVLAYIQNYENNQIELDKEIFNLD